MSTDQETKAAPGAAEDKPMTREQARERAEKGEALARKISERLPEGADRDKAMQAVKHFERARERLEPKREAAEGRSPEMKPAAQERNTAQKDAAAKTEQAERDRSAQQRETAAAAARDEQQQRARKPAEPERKPAAPDRSRDQDRDRD